MVTLNKKSARENFLESHQSMILKNKPVYQRSKTVVSKIDALASRRKSKPASVFQNNSTKTRSVSMRNSEESKSGEKTILSL